MFLKHDGNGYRYYNWTKILDDGEEEVLETDDVVQVDDVPEGTFPGSSEAEININTHKKDESDSIVAVIIIIIAAILIIGVGFYCYRRRKAGSSHTFHSEAHAPFTRRIN